MPAVILTLACKNDEPVKTEVRLEITSELAVDELELLVRDQNYLWDRLASAIERDITSAPFVVQLEPGRIDGSFLVFAKGYFEGVYVAGQSIVVAYQKDRVVQASIRLSADFVSSDADEDGFTRCRSGSELDRCDCDDRAPLVNPFSPEICGDDVDNDCSGGYPADGSGCPCTTDVPCTNLDEGFIASAGIGACTLGVLRCLDGTLADSCEGASTIRTLSTTPETPNNFIDDDCDGAVDEGDPCDPAEFPEGRACHRGFVDDAANASIAPVFSDLFAELDTPGNQATHLARGECAPGGAPPGRQFCDPTTRTWGSTCEGDLLPQRPPLPEEIDDLGAGAVVDLTSFTGVGFVELSLSGLVDANGDPIDQCDGRDNNCDGQYDEAPSFDADADGYTRCGSPVSFVDDGLGGLAVVRDQPGLEDVFIDCDDSNPDANPGEREVCDDLLDNDCLCDHGLSVGLPRFQVDGTFNCNSTAAALDCTLTGARSDPTEPGVCGESADGQAVYYWGYKNNAEGEKACYRCAAQFGLSCAPDGACSTKDADCCPCPAFPEPSEPDVFEAGQVRPFCGDATPQSCSCTLAAEWEPIAEGVDGFDDCDGVSCIGFYWGIQDNQCFFVRDAAASEVGCAGKPFCAGVPADDCCDPTDPQSCCQTPSTLCTEWVPPDTSPATLALPAVLANRGEPAPQPACFVAVGGCTGEVEPAFTPQASGEDLFEQCDSSFVCSDEATQPFYLGRLPSGADGSGPVRCFLKADVLNNACDGTGACQDQSEACSASDQRGPAVTRGPARICKVPTSGCDGSTPPVYSQAVADQTDPYDDCPDGNCCAGQCCAQQGEVCTATSECDSGLTCVDGVCCAQACAGACEACSAALTGVSDGTCTAIASVQIDDSPTPVCTADGGPCNNPPCICDGDLDNDGAALCLGDLGAVCGDDNECALGFCSDGFCCDSRCEGVCDACAAVLTNDPNGTPQIPDGTCAPIYSEAPPSPVRRTDSFPAGTCEGNSGCGATDCACLSVGGVPPSDSLCLSGQGAVCEQDSECLSGFCTDGFCCESRCDEACFACSSARSVADDGTCAEVAGAVVDGDGQASPSLTCGGSTGCSGADCLCQPSTGTCLSSVGACSVNADCPTFCSIGEGVCCDTACDGVCESCLAALTDEAADGTCAAITRVPPATDQQPAPAQCAGPAGCSGDDCACDPNVAGSCNGDIGSSCGAGTECISGSCVDGVCCESACTDVCFSCSGDDTGVSSGLCAPINMPGAIDDFPADICTGVRACNGNPSDPQCLEINGEVCASAAECLSGLCIDNRCCEGACDTACRACAANLTTGLPADDGRCLVLEAGGLDEEPSVLCSGAIGCANGNCECDVNDMLDPAGAGQCRSNNGQTCASADDCLSGFCVDGYCCDGACDGSCNACDLPGQLGACVNVPRGTPGENPACSDDFVCDGVSSECPVSCAGDDGLCGALTYCCRPGDVCNPADIDQCVSQKSSSNNQACARDAECVDGACVEGYCCNDSCSGACESCLAARSTSNTDGTCAPVLDNGEGDPVGSGGCPDNLRCDGVDRDCPSNCAVDLDCDGGFFCDTVGGNVCAPRQALGETCSVDAECASGFCTDGVCCDDRCFGTCNGCSALLKTGAPGPEDGICGAVLAGTDPDDECGDYFCIGGPDKADAACDTTCEDNDDGQCKADAFCSAMPGVDDDVCLPDLVGGACENPGDCQNDACWDGQCCDRDCSGTCETCTSGLCEPEVALSDPAGECFPYFCLGGAPACDTDCESNDDSQCFLGATPAEDYYCAEVSGANNDECRPLEAPGGTCEADSDCLAGVCSDEGVCCDASCAGECESCLAANTAAANGVCAPITERTDPKGACSAGLACDGVDMPANRATCASMCSGGGLCDASASMCLADHYCSTMSGTCTPLITDGTEPDLACVGEESSSCASVAYEERGSWVCCDLGCGEACESCFSARTTQPSDGVCDFVIEDLDGSPTCNGYQCSGTDALCTDSCVIDDDCFNGFSCDGMGNCVP